MNSGAILFFRIGIIIVFLILMLLLSTIILGLFFSLILHFMNKFGISFNFITYRK